MSKNSPHRIAGKHVPKKIRHRNNFEFEFMDNLTIRGKKRKTANKIKYVVDINNNTTPIYVFDYEIEKWISVAGCKGGTALDNIWHESVARNWCPCNVTNDEVIHISDRHLMYRIAYNGYLHEVKRKIRG